MTSVLFNLLKRRRSRVLHAQSVCPPAARRAIPAIPEDCLEEVVDHGPAAKPLLPQLRQFEKDLLGHRAEKGLQGQVEQVRKFVRDLETPTETTEPRGM